MIVIDASALLEVILGTAHAKRIAARLRANQETLTAPHLLDLEIAQVLRRYCAAGQITSERAQEVLRDLPNAPIERYPHAQLLERIWQLRRPVHSVLREGARGGSVKRREFVRKLSVGGLFPLAPALAGAFQASKPHLRSAICAYSFRQELQKKTMRYEDLVRLAADLGVDGLDLTVYWFPSATDDFLLPLRRLAYRSGIDIYSIGIRTNMCRPAAESQDAEAAKLAPWLEVAEKLGARHLRVFGGPVPKDATEDQGVAWIVETLKKCAGLAGQRGMTLGVEDDDPLTIKSERLVEIVKRVNSPWVGINLDVGNFRAEAYRQIEVCLPYAVNVHLKSEVTEEGRRVPTDWDRLLKLFAPVYRGYLALEYEGRQDAPTAVPELIRKLQHILPKYAPGA